MSYKLEQGVYFTSYASFESVTGLGLTAASRTDRDTLREMRKIAAQTTFYEKRTEYSFLYSETLGFCTAATTVCVSPKDDRPTPYIHMIFSGKHPQDNAIEYGFSAPFQTGTAALEGELPPIDAGPLPEWDPFREGTVTAPQLAWLIYRLWVALSDGNAAPLLLSPDGIPMEWEKPLQLMGVMSRLAELLPPYLRKSLWGTTAAAADMSLFRVRLSDSAEAVSLKQLPVLELCEGGYFEELCVRMAESYLKNRDEFSALCGRVDRQALCRLEQATASRLTLAACCVAANPKCSWTLTDANLRAVYERVHVLLPNQYLDQAFWQEQEAVLRRSTPPDNLRNLLQWFQSCGKSIDEQTQLLAKLYKNAPEMFLKEFHCLQSGHDQLLAALWEWPEMPVIMRKLAPENFYRAEVFYPYLTEQLSFWTFLPLSPTGAENARKFFSDQAQLVPAVEPEKLLPLFRAPLDLLAEPIQIDILHKSFRMAKTLPCRNLLEQFPKNLLQTPPVKIVLADYWHTAAKSVVSNVWTLKEWMEIGRLLDVHDEQVVAQATGQYLERMQTPVDADDSLSVLNELFPLPYPLSNLFFAKIQQMVETACQLEELEQLDAVLSKFSEFQRQVYSSAELKEKLSAAQLQKASLRALVLQDPPATSWEQFELWYKRLDALLNEGGDAGGLDKEDIDSVARTAKHLVQMARCSLARLLCKRFLTSCYPALLDMRYVSRQYDGTFHECIRQHIETLSKAASLQELYQYTCTDPVYPVQCPDTTWFDLTPGERLDILDQLETSDKAYPCYEKLFAPVPRFCDLIRRLFAPDCHDRTLREAEEEVLFECLAAAAQEIPPVRLFEQTLMAWRRVQPQPSPEQCDRLTRQLRTAFPPLDSEQLDQVWLAWDRVFPYTKNVLKKPRKSRKKNGSGQNGPVEWLLEKLRI